MTEHVRWSEPARAPVANDRLDSWKEIGAYLKRDVTTVRRWEKREGLPVHRHLHDRRESVYAYRHEVDRWWDERRNHLADRAPTEARVSRRVDARRRKRLAWALAAVALGTTLAVGAGFVVRDLRICSPRRSATALSGDPSGWNHLRNRRPVAGRSSPGVHGNRGVMAKRCSGCGHCSRSRPSPCLGPRTPRFRSGHQMGNGSDSLRRAASRRRSAAGGTPQIICDAPAGRGGAWSANGTILFSPSRESALSRVPDSGGSPTPVTTVDRPNETGHLWPVFLPDGNTFLYLADSIEADHHNLFVDRLAAPQRKLLFHVVSNAIYAPEGYLLFAAIDGKLLARPFDARAPRVRGGTRADRRRSAAAVERRSQDRRLGISERHPDVSGHPWPGHATRVARSRTRSVHACRPAGSLHGAHAVPRSEAGRTGAVRAAPVAPVRYR